ncbi:MAG: SIR2 family protein, partial [Nitrososphaerales archaeon]
MSNLLQYGQALRQLQKCGEQGLSLFVGAGISVETPSSCPAWNQLLNMLVSAAAGSHPRAAKLSEQFDGALTSIKPEVFCQAMYDNLLAEHFFGFLDVLYLGYPNRNHFAIGALARHMMIPLVLTTNFDVHVENAFEQMCLPHKLYVSRCPRKVLRRILNPKICGKTLPVLKIHGSIEDRPSIVITMRQAGRKLKADLAAVVQETLRSTPVLIVGYSGNDDDIFPEMLRVAAEAREVYWALWDNEKSLTSNIKVFKAACPNCTIIECDNKAILHDLAERVAKSSSVRQPDHHITPAEYVKRWIAGTPEECWINIFSELLLKTHCTDDSARAIAKETDTVRRTANDKWLLAKASANHGLAMSKLRDFEASVQSLLQAADHFMEMAHHREVVECLCNVVTETPLRPEWNGRSLASWSGDIAGRNYDPHQLGMYNLLAGVVFSEQR